ncbi:MAG: SDR family oxidoreductase [Bacteroidetes bacterium]|nr:SDR family oxidoreductase [Bacteroidota bacterium]
MGSFSEKKYWALILGGSSGFGLAAAKKLAEQGMNIFIVHKDRRGSMNDIEGEFEKIRSTGVSFVALNNDALTESGRTEILSQLADVLAGNGKIRLLLHSIAYGNLKPLIHSENGKETDTALLEEEDFARTIFSMGTSLAIWTKVLFDKKYFTGDARIIGLTSEGSSVAWKGYAAVSMAKGVLENLCRSMAVEFAPYGIRTNIIQAGVTDTPALRMVPGSKKVAAFARSRNPFKRLTTPEDVAGVIYLLCMDESSWINGAIIRADGGEQIAGGLMNGE